MSSKQYKLVAIVSHCAVLAQMVEDDETDEKVPSFFGAFMLTKDGQPAMSFAECECMIRVSQNFKRLDNSVVWFCNGYSQAVHECRSSVLPQNSIHHQIIKAENVEELDWNSEELMRLRAWPRQPEFAK
jgi:hypothetical protein